MPAIIEAFRAGLLGRRNWSANIFSGVIVAIVALPLAMAFAIAIGAKPEQGIYTAIIAGFFVSIFGGTRLQIAGPTGAFIVILSGITSTYGIAGLQIATLMAGVMLVFFGFARLGAFIKFIPAPVIIGFTAGIAIIIWVGQWENFFGLTPAIELKQTIETQSIQAFHEQLKLLSNTLPQLRLDTTIAQLELSLEPKSNTGFFDQLRLLLTVLPKLHWKTTLIGFTSLLLILFGSKKLPYLKKVPGPLIALILMTLVQSIFKFEGVATIGKIAGGLPQFALPSLSIDVIFQLIGPAFTIALLGSIESLLSASVADNMTGTRHNSNQELIGQGISNIIAPLFGGFAATGAIARTATNIRNGATSPLSGIIHSVTLLIIILFLAPLAANIPLACLAAILFVVAWNMSEVQRFRHIIKSAPKFDIAILLLTFLLTVFSDLVIAVNIGVILAMVEFLRRMASSVSIKQSTQEDFAELTDDICVLRIEGPLFFGAADSVEDELIKKIPDSTKALIIRFDWVPFIDATGIQALEYIIDKVKKRDIYLLISGANDSLLQKLKRGEIVHLVGESCVFPKLEPAITAAKAHIQTKIESEKIRIQTEADADRESLLLNKVGSAISRPE